MKTIRVYDRPMCCSTGICGPEVDPVLPKFAADLDWVKSQGHQVERYNLAQQPQAFIDNKLVHHILATEGTESLPLIIIDDQIVSRASYASREELIAWVEGAELKNGKVVETGTDVATGKVVKKGLPIANQGGGSCGSSGCC